MSLFSLTYTPIHIFVVFMLQQLDFIQLKMQTEIVLFNTFQKLPPFAWILWYWKRIMMPLFAVWMPTKRTSRKESSLSRKNPKPTVTTMKHATHISKLDYLHRRHVFGKINNSDVLKHLDFVISQYSTITSELKLDRETTKLLMNGTHKCHNWRILYSIFFYSLCYFYFDIFIFWSYNSSHICLIFFSDGFILQDSWSKSRR